MDDTKVRAALKVDANQMQLPDDLLERINRTADSTAPVRPSLWARLRLGARLEVAAACVLLVGMVGLAVFYNLNQSLAPGANGGGTQGSTSGAQRLHGLPSLNDVERAYFTGYVGASEQPLDHSVVKKVLGWLENAQVVGMDQEFVRKRGGDFYLAIDLRNGQRLTVRLAESCSVVEQGESTATLCLYARDQVNLMKSEGDSPRLHAPELADWLMDSRSAPGPLPSNLGPDYVVKKLEAAGLHVKLSGHQSPTLLGAASMHVFSVEDADLVVYLFEDAAAAQRAQRIMQDPEGHTVGWVGQPKFLQRSNLVIQVDFSDAAAAEKLWSVLTDN